MKTRVKIPIRVRINIAILVAMTLVFAIIPNILFEVWFNEVGARYEGGFAYILHDICPCSTDEEDCIGHYACGPEKANITYNLDTAPADLLAEAKRDQYFEMMIESVRNNTINLRRYIMCDISYLMSIIFLVTGVIYWNHNRIKA